MPANAVPSNETVLFNAEGTLYQQVSNGEDNLYDPLGDVDSFDVTIVRIKKAEREWKYLIRVYLDGELVIEQAVGTGMSLGYCAESSSVHWPAIIDGTVEKLAIRFSAENNGSVPPVAMMSRFVEIYNQCTYSLLTGTEVVDTSDEWYQYIGGINSASLSNTDTEEPVYDFDAGGMSAAATGKGNICYAESMQFNRALVVKHGGKDDLKLQAHKFKEDGFVPGSVETVTVHGAGACTGALLDGTEHKLMVFSNEASKIQEIDLTRGTVVEEYNTNDRNIVNLTYAAKFDKGPVYTGLTGNVAFNIDTRMDPRNCVVTEPGKQTSDYSLTMGKNQFTCHATSAEGHLVIGASDGSIRMYSGPPGGRKATGSGYYPKTAKTLLQTREPITCIDVTADGDYVVATSPTFVLFICTKFIDDNGAEKSGLTARMGSKKPAPLRLQPSPQHIMAMGGIHALSIRNAKFDRFEATGEHCVTACCGEYLLSWSLESLKKAVESGRSSMCQVMSTDRQVLVTSAVVPSSVTYLTDEGIGFVPIKEKKAVSGRSWTWGKK